MTTDSDKCSFSSIFPMSCRGRAEAFARRLHSRLRSLGSQDGSPTNESSWLATNENPIAISQPRHSSDSDLCFDFSLLDSPGSPEEEIPESELVNFVAYNKDNLHVVPSEDCYHTKPKITAISLNANCRPISPDSDSSEGQYFDPDSDIDSKAAPRLVNGLGEDCNGFNHYSEESALSLTVSEEDSTLDLWDCPVEFSSLTHDDSVSEVTKDVPSKISDSEDENKSVNDGDINLVSSNSTSIEQPIDIDSNSDVNQRSSESLRLNLSELDSNISNGYSDVGVSADDEITHETNPQDVQLINGIESINETTQTDSELLNKEEESYCSRLRIENNLTVDFDNSKESENALVNKVEVDIQPTNDEIEDQEEPTPRVRRCSSLKTGKTPPGTPGRKKIVRFADVLGLDLADVRTFLDEIPKIPNSAYSDLLNADLGCSLSDSSLSSTDNKFRNAGNKPDKMLVPLFQQPGGQINFLDRVRENQVCLENAVIDDPTALSVKGTVRVRNLDFHKSVHIRYSIDSWKSYSDLQAAYVQNSCDGFSDKFCFLLYANAVSVGQRLEFAVRFQCKGCQYWDSNNGANYAFQCLPSTSQTPYTPITGADDHWGATFY